MNTTTHRLTTQQRAIHACTPTRPIAHYRATVTIAGHSGFDLSRRQGRSRLQHGYHPTEQRSLHALLGPFSNRRDCCSKLGSSWYRHLTKRITGFCAGFLSGFAGCLSDFTGNISDLSGYFPVFSGRLSDLSSYLSGRVAKHYSDKFTSCLRGAHCSPQRRRGQEFRDRQYL